MPSYYDIDTILAEEELIPCTTLLDMNHMAVLDPDGVHDRRRRMAASEKDTTTASCDANAKHEAMILPENSRIKLPLWSIRRWAGLNFVRPQLPRHYGRKARERYDADPGDADLRYVVYQGCRTDHLCALLSHVFRVDSLVFHPFWPLFSHRTLHCCGCLEWPFSCNHSRKRNERFFLAGRMLVDVISQSAIKGTESLTKLRTNKNRLAHTRAMEQLSLEVKELRRVLIKLYAGERLRKIFDWSLSGVGGEDDVSTYLSKLTELEQRLFYTGSSASAALEEWKVFGNRRLLMGPVRPPKATTTMTTTTAFNKDNKRRAVTPGLDDQDRPGLRQRIQ